MFDQVVTYGPGTGTYTQHTFEIITMLLGSFLLGLWLGWLLWNKYKQQLEVLRLENESLKSFLTATHTDLSVVKTKASVLEVTNQSLSAENTELETISTNLAERVDRLEDQLETVKADNVQLENTLVNATASTPESAAVPMEVVHSPVDVHVSDLAAEGGIDLPAAGAVGAGLLATMKDALPDINLPKFELPKVELPKVEVPKFDLPEVNLPKVEVPKFDLPEVNLPKVEMPKFDLPEVNLPKVEMPKFDLPEVNLPKVEIPEVKLPEVPPVQETGLQSIMVSPATDVSPRSVTTPIEVPPAGLSDELLAEGGYIKEVKIERLVTAPVIDPAPTPVTPKPPVASYETRENLKLIEGIGPKIEEILNKNNIFTFAQLAATPVSRIKEMLIAEGSRFAVHDPATWPAQSLLAANSEWENLKAYQGYLSAGKSPDLKS